MLCAYSQHLCYICIKPTKGIIMSKTYKHQPTQPKQQRQANARYKREKAQPRKDWKSGLEWRLGKDD